MYRWQTSFTLYFRTSLSTFLVRFMIFIFLNATKFVQVHEVWWWVKSLASVLHFCSVYMPWLVCWGRSCATVFKLCKIIFMSDLMSDIHFIWQIELCDGHWVLIIDIALNDYWLPFIGLYWIDFRIHSFVKKKISYLLLVAKHGIWNSGSKYCGLQNTILHILYEKTATWEPES